MSLEKIDSLERLAHSQGETVLHMKTRCTLPLRDRLYSNRSYASGTFTYTFPDGFDFDKVPADSPLRSPGCNILDVSADDLAWLVDDLWWVWREGYRMTLDSGYSAPSWFDELPTARRRQLWWHFLHNSVEKGGDRSFVAFTPNVDYGKRDRQVRMSVGRYLSRFYSEFMSEEDIRRIVNSCKPLELRFGDTAQAFVQAYKAVPDSCMGGERRFSDLKHHPAEVYAGTGDFKIAVLVPPEAPQGDFSEARARAVVFRNDFIVRAYGDEATLLRQMLENAGISYDGDTGYYGGRLRKLALDQWGERFAMPYIDGTADWVTDDGDEHFLLDTTGDHECCSTQGYIETTELGVCDCCGNRTRGDELTWSEHTEEQYCSNCIDNGEIRSAIVMERGRRREYLVRDSDAIEIGGDYYINDSESLIELGFEYCHVSEEWGDAESFVRTIDDERVNLEAVCLVQVNVEDDEPIFATRNKVLTSSLTRLVYQVLPGSNTVHVIGMWMPPVDCGEIDFDEDGYEPDPNSFEFIRKPASTAHLPLLMARIDRFARINGVSDVFIEQSCFPHWPGAGRHLINRLADLHERQVKAAQLVAA